jgi:hypothetical protein
MAYIRCFKVDALEQDAFEVLRMVRSIKNSLAPITRIPPEVLSLIPDHYNGKEDAVDRYLIALTHVCRRWRDTFISRSSLWTRFDSRSVDKTRTYIQRSNSSPFKIYLGNNEVTREAFQLIIPHIRRLKSLTVLAHTTPSILKELRYHAPLLEKLDINIHHHVDSPLDDSLFNGDLPSLRELRLSGVITRLPWGNLANLKAVELHSLTYSYETTPLLDLFESAPLLHTISLLCSMSDLSNAPPERIVPLRHLKVFATKGSLQPQILLRHLHIPTGASLTLTYHFPGEGSPLQDYLPKRHLNFSNLSDITAINLFFDSKTTRIRLSGPSGSLQVLALRDAVDHATECQIFRSLDPILSTTDRLAISGYKNQLQAEIEYCPISQMLSSMSHLRTLILTSCVLPAFARALDPEQNLSQPVLCFNMDELVFCTDVLTFPDVQDLAKMANNRVSRGAKPLSITIVSHCGFAAEKFDFGEGVARVEIKYGSGPSWRWIPGEDGWLL